MTLDFPSNPETGDTWESGGNVYTWTGDRWIARAYTLEYPVPIYTNMVLTTPKDKAFGQPIALDNQILDTQENVNDFIAGVAEKGLKATTRAVDQIDFLQNSVGKGTWIRMDGILGPDETPGPGEFWADSTDFREIKDFVFNDSGLPGFTNPGSLEGTRVGDYLTVQANDTNSFGQYVIKEMTTENVGKSGVVVRRYTVSLIRDARSQGELPPLSRCSVTVARPMSVIVQDTQPVVSTRGILWYRESDDHLLISNYANGFTGEGEQWTDLTSGESYLPLSGGTVTGPTTFDCPTMVKWDEASSNSYPFSVYGGGKWTFRVGEDGSIKAFGNITINQESGTALNIKKGGIDKVKIEHGGRIFCAYDLSLDSDSRTVTTKGWVDSEIRTKGDDRYLQLQEGGRMYGQVDFDEATKLQMGGTYHNSIIDGKDGFTSNSLVATLGFVNHQIRENLSIGSLSPRDKMYLQGFYPWKVGAGSQIHDPGDFLPKKSDYNVDLNPETWSYLYFSVVDAYGQDLAGTFMNHMEMNKPRELQLWIARENGAKVCTFMGKMRCRDQNFEERFTVDLDVSDKDLVVSPNYDTASLEISRGEILWIKCSAWGN